MVLPPDLQRCTGADRRVPPGPDLANLEEVKPVLSILFALPGINVIKLFTAVIY